MQSQTSCSMTPIAARCQAQEQLGRHSRAAARGNPGVHRALLDSRMRGNDTGRMRGNDTGRMRGSDMSHMRGSDMSHMRGHDMGHMRGTDMGRVHGNDNL